MGIALETIQRVLSLKNVDPCRLIFGYLCKPADIHKVIQDQMESLLRSRKLPLVLDLDDTLVRVVGDSNPDRYVPEGLVPQGLA